jgi:hypothetical protein
MGKETNSGCMSLFVRLFGEPKGWVKVQEGDGPSHYELKVREKADLPNWAEDAQKSYQIVKSLIPELGDDISYTRQNANTPAELIEKGKEVKNAFSLYMNVLKKTNVWNEIPKYERAGAARIKPFPRRPSEFEIDEYQPYYDKSTGVLVFIKEEDKKPDFKDTSSSTDADWAVFGGSLLWGISASLRMFGEDLHTFITDPDTYKYNLESQKKYTVPSK